jgi:hypothetical protein
MKSKAIYYKENKEGINSKGKDKGIYDKGWDNRRDYKSKIQSFICISNTLFINNSINKKSS